MKKLLIATLCSVLFACADNEQNIIGTYTSENHDYSLQFSEDSVIHSKFGLVGDYSINNDNITLEFVYVGSTIAFNGTIDNKSIVFIDNDLEGVWVKK